MDEDDFESWLQESIGCCAFREKRSNMFSRLTSWIVGPAWLGGNIGFAVGLAIMFWPCWNSNNDWPLHALYQIPIGAFAAYFGACIGSASARDEFLRDNWVRYRPLVGLVGGALVGGCSGLLLWDGWILLAGSVGGGVGGLADSVIDRNILEEDW